MSLIDALMRFEDDCKRHDVEPPWELKVTDRFFWALLAECNRSCYVMDKDQYQLSKIKKLTVAGFKIIAMKEPL